MAQPSKPGPTITEKPVIKQSEDGTLLMFESRITTDTPPDVIWWFNDVRVKPGPRHKVAVDKEGTNTYFCTLEVMNPTRNDAGKYQIRARNADGESSATVFSYFG